MFFAGAADSAQFDARRVQESKTSVPITGMLFSTHKAAESPVICLNNCCQCSAWSGSGSGSGHGSGSGRGWSAPLVQ